MRWRHTWPGALDGRAGIGGFSSLGRSTPTLTHTHARAHTHLTEMQPPTDVCRSLTHGRTHAEAHAHAHTSARVAGAPGVFKARTQAVSVCMRAPRCVFVCPWMCACVVAAHACECVCPDCVCSTVRWGADLRAILRHIWVTVLFSVYRPRFFRGLGLDRPNRCGHICDTGQVLRTDPPRSSTHVSRARKIEKVLPGAGKGPSQFHMALWYGAFASRRRVKAAGACSTVLVGARGQMRKRFANRFNRGVRTYA